MQTAPQLGIMHAQLTAALPMDHLQTSGGHIEPLAACQQDPTAAGPAAVDDRIQVSLEVSLIATSTAPFDEIKSRLFKQLDSRTLRLREGPLPLTPGEDLFLDEHISEVCVTIDCVPEAYIGRSFFLWELDICIRWVAGGRRLAQLHACMQQDRWQ